MNENTDNTEERFYDPKKPKKFHEFCPEPIAMCEAKAMNLKFTVGNKYEELDRKEFHHRHVVKCVDDCGTEQWVDDKFFIPVQIALCGEKEVGGWNPKNGFSDNEIPLPYVAPSYGGDESKYPQYCGEKWNEYVKEVKKDMVDAVDIRKEAKKRKVKPLSIEGEDVCEKETLSWSSLEEGEIPDLEKIREKAKPIEPESDEFKDLTVLSGIKREKETEPKYCWWNTGDKFLYNGIVHDKGNDLLEDAGKCWEAVNNEFGSKRFNSDFLLGLLCEAVGHKLEWQNGFLTVGGLKTKIKYKEVKEAISGLQPLISEKKAQEVVAKVVMSKLKNVF